MSLKRPDLKLVLLVSVLLRVAAALYLGNAVTALPGTADQVSYHHLALRVVDGHGFSFEKAWWPLTAAGAPTAHWSYLYTLYLAALYALLGPAALAARLVQAVLVGLLQPYLAYRLAGELFPARAAGPFPLLAAGLTAIYPYFVYYAATLMTEPFYITAVLASLVVAVRLARHSLRAGSARLGILLGLALTAAVLLRQLFLLVVPFLYLWLWLSAHRSNARPQMLRSTLVSSSILVLALLAAAVFNYARFNRLVLLNTNAGFAFYWANHPVYGGQFIAAADMNGTYGRLIPAELKHLDEASLDRELLRRGIGFVLDDPGRYLRLSASRIPHYFKFWPDPDSSLISNLIRTSSFGLLLPFMLYGLLRPLAGAARLKTQGLAGQLASPSLLLYGFIGLYTLIHLLSWAQVRYRLPVDAVLLLFAAVAIADLAALARRAPRAIGARNAALNS